MAYLENLDTIDSGTWTPTITSTGTNPTITYTTQDGEWFRIADVVIARADILINTYSGGTGAITIQLPIAASSSTPDSVGSVFMSNVTFSGSYVTGLTSGGTTNLFLRDHASATPVSNLAVTALSAGDRVKFQMVYWVD